MKILKNTTISDIELIRLGISIPASDNITLDPRDYMLTASDDSITELTILINSGDVVVNDGINDITVANGFNLQRAIDFLKHPDKGFNVRFESEPDRENGFVANNVQEAIEEAKSAIEGKVSVLPTFLNNGLTKNKWLTLDGSMSNSDELPAITTFDSVFSGLSYANTNNDSDVDLEFYKNGTTASELIFTWEIRNKRYAFKTNGLDAVTFSRGDRISCFAKEYSGGTGGNASSVIVYVLVQSTNSVEDEGGQQTL